jgi:hypothetical protein
VQILGYIFLALIAIGVVIGLVLFFSGLPDLARYRRIRKM